jgi:hypothetical protein
MKQLLIISFLLIQFSSASAQQEGSSIFIELTPSFTNKLSGMPYENRLNNNRPLYHPPVAEEPILQKYYGWCSGLKLYKHIKQNWYIVGGLSLGINKYSGTLNYTFSDVYTATSTKYTNQEDINGLSGDIRIGIGKQCFLDAEKKVFILPEALVGLTESGYYGSYTLGNYLANYNYLNESFGVGAQLNLKFAYQFNNHFALGLTLKDLVNLHKLYSERKEVDGSTFKDQKVIFSIGPTLIPTLNLILVLH